MTSFPPSINYTNGNLIDDILICITSILIPVSNLTDISWLFLELLQIIQKNKLTSILHTWVSVLTGSTHHVSLQRTGLKKSFVAGVWIFPRVNDLNKLKQIVEL